MRIYAFIVMVVFTSIIAFGQSNSLEVELKTTGNEHGEGISLIRNVGFLKLQNGTNVDSEFQARISGRADSDRSPGLVLVGSPSLIDFDSRGILIRGGETDFLDNGNILEIDNFTTTHLSLDWQGRLGLGTTVPKAKVHVEDGDIFIGDINKGVIMKSPNGTCWRFSPDDLGQLVGTAVSCPN